MAETYSLTQGSDLFLELYRTKEAEETLTATITCTNGSIPSRLGIGDVSIPTADIPEGIVEIGE